MGPYLLALFMNNIFSFLGTNSHHKLFADDLRINMQCSPYDPDVHATFMSAAADDIICIIGLPITAINCNTKEFAWISENSHYDWQSNSEI